MTQDRLRLALFVLRFTSLLGFVTVSKVYMV